MRMQKRLYKDKNDYCLEGEVEEIVHPKGKISSTNE
jgi:hypothetical protein